MIDVGSIDSLAPLAVTDKVGVLMTNHRIMTPTNNPPKTMCPAFFVSARFQNARGAGASVWFNAFVYVNSGTTVSLTQGLNDFALPVSDCPRLLVKKQLTAPGRLDISVKKSTVFARTDKSTLQKTVPLHSSSPKSMTGWPPQVRETSKEICSGPRTLHFSAAAQNGSFCA